MAIYRALHDEKGNPYEHYYSEEAATAAYYADIRMGWQVQVGRGRWVDWAPSVTREEHETARRQRERDELAEWLRSNGKMPAPRAQPPEPDCPT